MVNAAAEWYDEWYSVTIFLNYLPPYAREPIILNSLGKEPAHFYIKQVLRPLNHGLPGYYIIHNLTTVRTRIKNLSCDFNLGVNFGLFGRIRR